MRALVQRIRHDDRRDTDEIVVEKEHKGDLCVTVRVVTKKDLTIVHVTAPGMPEQSYALDPADDERIEVVIFDQERR